MNTHGPTLIICVVFLTITAKITLFMHMSQLDNICDDEESEASKSKRNCIKFPYIYQLHLPHLTKLHCLVVECTCKG